jgi:peptide/nickel transport system substrate-binding protein
MIDRRTFLKTALGSGAATLVAGRARRSHAAEPRRGGQLTVGHETDPITFNGAMAVGFATIQVTEHCYESLTAFDAKMNVVPALAERWEHPTPLTYVFHLRPGVKFHNGKPLVAADVKYTFDRLLAKETASPNRSWYDSIETVEVVNPSAVRMTLGAPFGGILANFAALRGSQILPAGIAEKINLGVEAIGTGPFRLVEYTPRNTVKYARHPDYWNRSLPHLDGMTWKIMVEEDTRVAGLRSGGIDFALLSPEGQERLKGVPSVAIRRNPRAWLVMHEFNCARKPFSDVRVRQAVGLAADRQEMIQKAASGAGVLTGPVATGHRDWFIPPDQLGYRQDIARAKQLLAEAGYPNGFKTTIKVLAAFPDFPASTVVFAEQLRRINIEAEIIQLEGGEFAKQYRGKDFDIFSTGRTNYPDADVYLYQFFHPKGVFNRGYENPKVTELLERGRSTEEHARRRAIYLEVQRILLDELPHLWWYVGLNVEGLQQHVKGYESSFLGSRFFKQVWLDK